jgi:hypothetical protein
MRNASVKDHSLEAEVRATFVCPRPLYEAYRQTVKQQDLTFSQAVRKHMRETLDELEEAA